MIVDAHSHIGRGIRLADPYDIDITPETTIRMADVAGIDKTVVFPISYLDYSQGNMEVAAAVKKYPERLIGFCRISCGNWHEPHRTKELHNLEEALTTLKLKGVKIHEGLDQGFPNRDVVEVMIKHDVPMIIHQENSPLRLEPMIKSYPDLKVIICHLGGYPGDYIYSTDTIYLLEKHENVYADTAQALHNRLQEAVDRVGPEKLIFGSDGPWYHPAVEKMRVEILNVSKSDKEKILGGNILKLLKL